MILQDTQQIIVTENSPTRLSMLVMSLKLKIWLVWLINSIISKKDSIIPIFANLSALVSLEITAGHSRQIMGLLLLVSHHKACTTPKTFCMWKVGLTRKINRSNKCIGKPMVILHQVNKNKETIIGNLTLLIIGLGTEKRKYSMAHKMLYTMKETMKIFRGQWSFKKQLKIIELLHLIYLASQRILDKAKYQEVQILFMEREMFKEMTHGMPLDVFMVNQHLYKFFRTKI